MLKQTMWKVLPAFTLFLAACGAETPSIDKVVEIPAEVKVSLEDQSVTLDEDTTVEIVVKAAVEPADAGAVALTIDQAPAHGTLTGDAGSYTYAPAPDFNGEDEVKITAKIGDKSATATIKIIVNPMNDAPFFTAGVDVAADEDAGAQAIVWATGIAAGPLDELEAVTFEVSNDNSALFLVQPFIDDSGTLHFTSVTDASGVANVTVSLSDGELSSAEETFVLTVNPVNDTPSFTAGADQTVLEDSGAATVAGWATNLSAGPLDESGQSLVFVVSSDNSSLFSAQPTVATNGTLSFTPAANAFGTATVSVAIKDNAEGANTSVAQNFTITITNINDRPSYTAGGNVTVAEDSGQYATAWATNVSAGPNEAGQALSFTLTLTTLDQAKFASQPTMSSTGMLYFVPAADVFGSANVRVILSDDGGTANGGANVTLEQFFTIQINSVNDAPSMVTSGTVTVNEDSGAYSNANWATDLRVGPANESSQTLSRTVTNDNNALFSVQPALSATGALTFTPAADAHGTATVSYTLGDGTLETIYTSVVEILSVNDAPSFTVSPSLINLVEDQGAGATLSQSDLIVSPSAGPADEASQTLSYSVTVTGADVFALAPTIQTTNLVFSLAENVAGTATLTIIARDDGGTAHGGVDTSTAQVITVNVSDVNDAPIVVNDSVLVKENHPIDIDVLGNDSDVEGTALTISAVDTTGTNGTVTRINGNTAVRFVPANGYTGTTTFTYTASDGNLTATATVTVEVEPDNEGPILINTNVTAAALLNRSSMDSGGALNPAIFEFDDYNFDEASPLVTASLAGLPLIECPDTVCHYFVDKSVQRTIRVLFFDLESVKTFDPHGEALSISLTNIKDDMGNTGDSVQVEVVLDLVEPSITWYDFNNDPEMRAVAFFSEAMEPNSFNTFVFEEKDTGIDVQTEAFIFELEGQTYEFPGSGSISRNYADDGFYFVPASSLNIGTEYRVDISNFTDLAGNKVNSSPHDFTVCCSNDSIKIVRFDLIDASDAVVQTFSPAQVTHEAIVFPATITGETLDLRVVFDRELSTEWSGSYLRAESTMDGEEFHGQFESVDAGTNNAVRIGKKKDENPPYNEYSALEWAASVDYRLYLNAGAVTDGSLNRAIQIAVKTPDDGHAPYVTVVNGWSTFFGKPEIRSAEPLFIAFSERLDPTLVGPENFEIRNGGLQYPVVLERHETGGVWLRAADAEGKPIVLPTGPDYFLDVKDLADLSTPARIGTPQSFAFSVISPWDGTLTEVASSNPSQDSLDVPFRPIDLFFTLPIDAHSLVSSGAARNYALFEGIGDKAVRVKGLSPSEPSLMPQQRISLGQRHMGLKPNSTYALVVSDAVDVNGRNLTAPFAFGFSTGDTTSTGPVIFDADVRLDVFGATFTVGGDAVGNSAEIGVSFSHQNTAETFTYGLSNLSIVGGEMSEAADMGHHDTTVPDIDLFFIESAYSTLVHTIDDSVARRDTLRHQVYRLSNTTVGAAPSWQPVTGKPGVYTFQGTVTGLDAVEIKGVEIYVGVLDTVTNDLQGLVYRAPAQIQWEIGSQTLTYEHTMPDQAALPTLPGTYEYVAVANIRVPQKMVATPRDSSGITLESSRFNP